MFSLRFQTQMAFAVLTLPLFAAAQTAVQDKPLPRSLPRPSAATVQQWQDRKFGMFIHFGLYSGLGGTWQGKPVDNGYSEQIMANAPIPLEQYAATAGTFNPVSWNPDAIVSLAKAAGMRYIVITSKHHDGFNLFHTAQTAYNVVDATPYRRDIVKELAEACRRGGLGFGVYYSSIDWHQPGMDHYIEGNSNPLTGEHARFNAAQLRELLSNYGPISEIWFDMGKPTPEQSRLFTTTVHNLQPQTMVSGRVWNYEGDFAVMGDNEVPAYGIDEPWQTPASIFPDTWGYRSWEKRSDLQGKIEENIVRLVQVVSRGGNYILNIGPEGDGSVVPYEADVLRGVGAWLKPNAEAIYGTTASPFEQLDFGFATRKGTTVYLFVKPQGGARDTGARISLRLPRAAQTRWASAALLDSSERVVLRSDGDDTVVDVPATAIHGPLTVVRLRAQGPVRVKVQLPAPGPVTLTFADAEKFYNYNGRGYEAPKTLYKLRWMVRAGAACLSFHTEGQGDVALVADGRATTVNMHDGLRQTASVGADNLLEITPPEPFLKGANLPLQFRSVDLSPAPCR